MDGTNSYTDFRQLARYVHAHEVWSICVVFNHQFSQKKKNVIQCNVLDSCLIHQLQITFLLGMVVALEKKKDDCYNNALKVIP